MDVDSGRLLPQSNDWFSTTVEYEGRAKAHFLDPKAVVEGDARIRFFDNGHATAEMKVEGIKSVDPLPLGIFQLFTSAKPTIDRTSTTLSLGEDDLNSNPCTRLTIDTEGGTFGAVESIGYSTSHDFARGDQSSTTLNFDLFRSQFDNVNLLPPEYWVIPLTNFISDFVEQHTSLDKHALRIFPLRPLPDDLTDEQRAIAEHNARLRNRLIIFEHNGALAFIEPLPDYADRKERLHRGVERSIVTALMIGTIDIDRLDSSGLMDSVPIDFLRLLAMATGQEVGAPWIELRDSKGNLTQRTHISLGRPIFMHGRGAINEIVHRSTGRLLTTAPSSSGYERAELRVAIVHLVKSGLYSLTLEDRLIHVVRSLECLIRIHGLNEPLALEDVLGKDAAQDLRSEVSECLDATNLTRRRLREEGFQEESEALNDIQAKIRGAMYPRKGFGKNAAALIKLHNFPDVDIANDHYREYPRADKLKRWESVLSKYRGVALHDGYLDFASGKFDPLDVHVVVTHLRDVLVRIVFKILEYDRAYQPVVRTMAIDAPIDWVKRDTPARLLGYR